jgi:transposase
MKVGHSELFPDRADKEPMIDTKSTTPPAPARSERSERSAGAGGVAANLPDPHAKPARRKFTEAYRLRILTEIDKAEPGQIGVILRREGLYSPMLTRWRRWRDEAAKKAKKPPAREADKSWRQRAERAEREVGQLRLRLKKTEALVDLQKKLASVFDLIAPAEGSQP